MRIVAGLSFVEPVLAALGNLRVKEAVPMLIRYLRHADPHIRGLAANALIVTTKKAFRYSATAEEDKREAGVQKWEDWWAKNGASFEVT